MIKDVIIRYCAVIAGCTRGKIADLSARWVSENAPPEIILELHLMKKRTFIKLFAAALASPPVMRLLAWAGQEKLRNWADNIEYSTDRLQTSTSLAQVQDYVKTQPKLKVLGTRHCFNNIADSKDGFLSLKPMDEVCSNPFRRDRGTTVHTWALPFTTSPRYPISPWRARAAQQHMDHGKQRW
jgi:hypothetical protein